MTTKDVNAAIWKIEAPEAVKRGILGPMYTRSIDASMAVIQRRWPGASAHLWTKQNDRDFAVARIWSPCRMKILGDATEPMVHEKGDNTNHSVAHALALALLAALEAETEP